MKEDMKDKKVRELEDFVGNKYNMLDSRIRTPLRILAMTRMNYQDGQIYIDRKDLRGRCYHFLGDGDYSKRVLDILEEEGFVERIGRRYALTLKGREYIKNLRDAMKYGW